MPENLFESVPVNKLYKESAVRIATFLGGPLVAGYLIAENYKSLGQPAKAKTTWIYTIVLTIVIFGAIMFIPEVAKVPNYIIPIIFAGIASLLVQRLQGTDIKLHTEKGGQFYTIWRALLASLIGFVVTFGILILVVVITDTGDLFK